MNWLMTYASDPLTIWIGMVGLQHHPLEQITNVNWEAGLAVEFFEKET